MFSRQSRWDEAEKLLIQVLDASRINLGADDPDTLSTTANLGTLYVTQGRLEEAEKLEVQEDQAQGQPPMHQLQPVLRLPRFISARNGL